MAKKSTKQSIADEVEYAYDAIPYGGAARLETHPDSLATRATLFGLEPAPIETAKILEIGCGDGANLISIAATLPESECYGIDLSATQIGQGQETIDALELGNIKLEQKDIQALPAKPRKKWDYVICHGVLSWVTPEVEGGILDVIKRHLAPDGIAYVSYNCYPGWHLREMVRNLMRFHSAPVEETADQVTASREIVAGLAQSVPAYLQGYAAFLRDEQNLLNQCQDSYIAHEHLEEQNRPVYFKDAFRNFADKKLQYLCEANLSSMFINRFPASVGRYVRQDASLDEIEQYLDFIQLRMFRQSLLCHENAKVERNLRPELVRSMHAAAYGVYEQGPSPAITNQPETFQGPRGANLTTNQPIAKAALQVLAENWPRRIPFDELLSLAQTRLRESGSLEFDTGTETGPSEDAILAETLVAGCTAEILDLHVSPGCYVTEVSENPLASPLARSQASGGEKVTTLRHTMINPDQLTQHLLPMLDGKNDRTQLLEGILKIVEEDEIGFRENGVLVTDPDRIRGIVEQQVENQLVDIARLALLAG